MYEKAGELDKSLLDIAEVLALDVYHIKARTRRGRLYEAQVILVIFSSALSAFHFISRPHYLITI